jgi:hypothetical protein
VSIAVVDKNIDAVVGAGKGLHHETPTDITGCSQALLDLVLGVFQISRVERDGILVASDANVAKRIEDAL